MSTPSSDNLENSIELEDELQALPEEPVELSGTEDFSVIDTDSYFDCPLGESEEETGSEVPEPEALSPELATLLSDRDRSEFGLAIAEGPLILVSISVRAGRQAVTITPEILGLSEEQAMVLREKQISNMTAPLLHQQQKAVSALKGRRRTIYETCSLQLNGSLRFVKGSKLEEFITQYRELQELRNNWADVIRSNYTVDRQNFLLRIRSVLSTMGIDQVRQGVILNRCDSHVPTVEQILEAFSVELDGPYYIPPASEMVEYNTQMRVAMSERREFELVSQLRAESIDRLRLSLVGSIEDARQTLLATIGTEVGKLTQAVNIGKAGKRKRSLAAIANQIRDLLEYCESDETLEGLLTSIDSLTSHLGTEKISEDLLNEQLAGISSALGIEKAEPYLSVPASAGGSHLRNVIRPAQVE